MTRTSPAQLYGQIESQQRLLLYDQVISNTESCLRLKQKAILDSSMYECNNKKQTQRFPQGFVFKSPWDLHGHFWGSH